MAQRLEYKKSLSAREGVYNVGIGEKHYYKRVWYFANGHTLHNKGQVIKKYTEKEAAYRCAKNGELYKRIPDHQGD